MTQVPKIILSNAIHKNREIVCLIFDYDASLHTVVKTLKGRQWSHTFRSWYVENRAGLLDEICALFNGKALIDYSRYSTKLVHTSFKDKRESKRPQPATSEQKENLEQLIKWMRSRRYSETTIGTYSDALKIFFQYFGNKSIQEINNNDLIDFNNEFILKNKLSASYQNQVINAVKLFFRIQQSKNMEVDLIHRPKRAKALPNVLSKEEIKLILSASSNIKHKAMLSLVYSCGLRRSELLNLKLNEVDSNRGLIVIKRAKGKKDRVVPLSGKMLELLREYYVAFKPKEWLFEGQNKLGPYDESSLVNVLRQALAKSGIKKPVTLHWLRHSYATHLLESGTDLRYIQEILGHSRSTTTEIYTHVSIRNIQKVVSPFENS